ncbi:hypothetical protein K7711_03160 [Nocardia sp. CA2R105]|uniref:hypothetical protein n=1 Tax=Nocardia coffeae TaxID=2873381 RepID=UPI001CA6BAC1|nr:hypothetical protein [Nocardia coffeae]MBY8855467.1 hypothetical protein [Nocardia coffeae]
MAERAVHLVGSFPAESTEEAMRAMLEGTGGRLRTLPTGEVRRHEFYILPIIEGLVDQGVLEAKRPVLPGMSRRPVHRLARQAESPTSTMDLGYLRETEEALPIFAELCESAAGTDPILQIGMPTDFTLGFIAMGLSGARSHRRVFTEATVREIEAVVELTAGKVIVQLEAPAELVLMTKAYPSHRMVDAALGLSRGIGALAAAAPEGTRFGVHLCLGSRGNRTGAVLRSARPVVDLANAVVRHWPAGRTLEFLHGPLAGVSNPPSGDPEFYAPLADLALGEGTAFYAGFVHESPDEAEQTRTLHMIEQALGRPVDAVASPCGLGRDSRPLADAHMARALALTGVE